MPRATPHELKLDPDLRARMEQAIIDQIKDAVAGATKRDQFFLENFEIIEGTQAVQSNARWEGACNLNWQLARKAKLTIMAQLLGGVRKSPNWIVLAHNKDAERSAEAQEHFLASKRQFLRIDEVEMELADYATTYPLAVCSATWVERWSFKRDSVFVDPQTGYELTEDQLDHDQPYDYYQEKHERNNTPDFRGVELRAVHTPDFYTYPTKGRCLDPDRPGGVYGCGERVKMLAGQLLAGITRDEEGVTGYGLDRETVLDLIDFGPCSLSKDDDTPSGEADDILGLDDVRQVKDEYYECFTWYTRPPLIYDEDGDLLTPEYMLHDDLLCFVCPAANKVLRMDYCPDSSRPYGAFYMLKNANRLYGVDCCQLLYTEQSEATSVMRAFIDAMNLTMTPGYKVKRNAAQMNDTLQVYPGFNALVDDHEDIMPFEHPQMTHDPIAVVQSIDGQAKELYAGSKDYGVTNKVYKAQQVQQQQQQTASAFSLLAFDFFKSSEWLAAKIISLYADNMDDSGEDFLDELDMPRHITPRDLKGEFSYISTVTDQTASPEMRLAMGEKLAAVVQQYITASIPLMQAQAFEQLGWLWSVTRKVITDLGEYNPELYIGEKPKAPEGGMAPPMMGGMMGGILPQGANGNGHQPGFAQVSG